MQPAAAVCKKRICYYGGSFDPPTYGHMIAAAAVAACGAADEVWISPCGGEAASASSTDRSPETTSAVSPKSTVLSASASPTAGGHATAVPHTTAAVAANAAALTTTTATVNGDVSTTCSTLSDEADVNTTYHLFVNPLHRPDKKVKSSPQARLAMTHLAVNHFFGPADIRRVPVKVLGREADTRGYTPTLKLLLQLAAEEEEHQQQHEPQQQRRSTEFLILVGEDVVPDLPRWHGAEKLMENYFFLILPRSTASHHLPPLLPNVLSCNMQSSDLTQRPGLGAAPQTASEKTASAPSAAESGTSVSGAKAAAASPPAEAALSGETPEAETAAVRASAAAAQLRARVAAVLQRVRRYAYMDKLCLERGVPYFHWPCSSTFARRVLLHLWSDPAAALQAVSLICPPVLAYIEEHGLYRG